MCTRLHTECTTRTTTGPTYRQGGLTNRQETSDMPADRPTDTELCATCGRNKDEPPGGECESQDWHVTPDVTPDVTLHLGLNLERISMVAVTLHATWCPTAGAGCTYSERDLQVALDAAVAVRHG